MRMDTDDEDSVGEDDYVEEEVVQSSSKRVEKSVSKKTGNEDGNESQSAQPTTSKTRKKKKTQPDETSEQEIKHVTPETTNEKPTKQSAQSEKSKARVQKMKGPLMEITQELKKRYQKRTHQKKPAYVTYFIDGEAKEDNKIHFKQMGEVRHEASPKRRSRKRRVVIHSSDCEVVSDNDADNNAGVDADVDTSIENAAAVASTELLTNEAINKQLNDEYGPQCNVRVGSNSDAESQPDETRAEQVRVVTTQHDEQAKDETQPDFDLVIRELNKVKSVEVLEIKKEVLRLKGKIETGICPGSQVDLRDSVENSKAVMDKPEEEDPLSEITENVALSIDNVTFPLIEKLVSEYNKHSQQKLFLNVPDPKPATSDVIMSDGNGGQVLVTLPSDTQFLTLHTPTKNGVLLATVDNVGTKPCFVDTFVPVLDSSNAVPVLDSSNAQLQLCSNDSSEPVPSNTTVNPADEPGEGNSSNIHPEAVMDKPEEPEVKSSSKPESELFETDSAQNHEDSGETPAGEEMSNKEQETKTKKQEQEAVLESERSDRYEPGDVRVENSNGEAKEKGHADIPVEDIRKLEDSGDKDKENTQKEEETERDCDKMQEHNGEEQETEPIESKGKRHEHNGEDISNQEQSQKTENENTVEKEKEHADLPGEDISNKEISQKTENINDDEKKKKDEEEDAELIESEEKPARVGNNEHNGEGSEKSDTTDGRSTTYNHS